MNPELSYNDRYGAVIMKIPERAGFSEEFDAKKSAEFIARIADMLDKSERRLLICDVSKSNNSRPSKKMRKWMAGQASVLNLDRIAIVGASPVIRMVAKIMVAAVGQQHSTRFFKGFDEALAWIKVADRMPAHEGA